MENKSRRDEKCAKQAERINCSWQHAGGADYWDDYVPRGFKGDLRQVNEYIFLQTVRFITHF